MAAIRADAVGHEKRRCRCFTNGKSAAPAPTKRSQLTGRPHDDERASAAAESAAGRSPTRWFAAPSNGSKRSTRFSSSHAQNWRIERMAVIDRLILRLAIYEFLADSRDTVAASSSTKRWSSRAPTAEKTRSPFVNGVLDSVKRELRPELLKP